MNASPTSVLVEDVTAIQQRCACHAVERQQHPFVFGLNEQSRYIMPMLEQGRHPVVTGTQIRSGTVLTVAARHESATPLRR